jgi:hypothetical protein
MMLKKLIDLININLKELINFNEDSWMKIVLILKVTIKVTLRLDEEGKV